MELVNATGAIFALKDFGRSPISAGGSGSDLASLTIVERGSSTSLFDSGGKRRQRELPDLNPSPNVTASGSVRRAGAIRLSAD